MTLCTVTELQQAVEMAGWKICSVQNRRFQSLRTLMLWKQNLADEYKTQVPPGQLRVLQRLTETALSNLFTWAQSFPLIDIIAEKN